MSMIIIRLQNLPWAADSMDIRRYFSGLSIPEGGVHIVGGEAGDAFIAFSSDEDARLAMAKDGGAIHEVQVKLLLSSRAEMAKVIERARQQNFAPQVQPTAPSSAPSPMAAPMRTSAPPPFPQRNRSPSPHHRGRRDRSPNDRERLPGGRSPAGRDRSPSSRERLPGSRDRLPGGRDRSPGGRDRHRSPESNRRIKRERSRSPPSRGSRGNNRDTDRRSDRFKRDERRYDEDSRHRESDRRSSRDQDPDSKKYPDSNRQSEQPFHENSNRGHYNVSSNNMNYMSQPKDLPPAFMNPSTEKNLAPLVDSSVLDKIKVSLNQIASTTANTFQQSTMAYSSPSYDQSNQLPGIRSGNQSAGRSRTSRFEPDFKKSEEQPYFVPSDNKKILPPLDSIQNSSHVRNRPQDNCNILPNSRDAWKSQERQLDPRFHDSHQRPQNTPLMNQVSPNNNDYNRPIPMDLDPPETQVPKSFIADNTPHSLLNPPQPFNRNEKIPRNNASGSMPMPNRSGAVNPPNEWQKPSPSFAVEVRGLPPDTRIGEIIDLFPTCSITPSNICVVNNKQGVEKALVRLANIGEFDRALSVQNCYVRNNRCVVIECPFEVFEATVAVQNSFKARPKPKPREEDLVVQLRGLPFSCGQSDLVRFFEGVRFRDMFISIAPDGRATGNGFVELVSLQDFRSALTLNGKMIGHRYITISVASKEMMAYARGEECTNPIEMSQNPTILQKENDGFQQGPPVNVPNEQRQNAVPFPRTGSPRRTPYSLSLRNLPIKISNDVLVNFFKDINVKITAIHSLMTPENQPSGDAFVEVSTQKDADVALSGDGKIIFGNRISIKQVPYQEVAQILDIPYPPAPPGPGPLLKTPIVEDSPNPNFDHSRKVSQSHLEGPGREYPPDYPSDDCPPHFQPRDGPGMEPRRERPMDYPRGERPRMDFQRERPRMGFGRGERPRMLFGRGPRMDFRGERPMRVGRPPMERHPRPPFGRMRGHPPNRPFRPQGSHDSVMSDFGAPGCIVSINNLHFRAGLEELLEFFHDYNLTKENILRKFNENDEATGEARIAFHSPWEAQKAARELNQKSIMGRSLTLSVL